MKKLGNIAQILEKIKQPGMIASFIKKAGITFVIQVVGAGLGYLLQVFLARVMGHGEYGLYTYILSWASIGGVVCNLGLPGAVLRFIPQYSTKGDWGRFQGIILGSSRFTFTISIGMSLLGTIILLFFRNSSQHLAHFIPILLGIWTIPLLALEALQRNLFRGGREMVYAYAPSNVLRPLLLIGSAIVIIIWQGTQILTSQTLFIITIASYIVLISSQQILIHKGLLTQGEKEKPIYELRAWLRVSLPLLLITGFVIILYQTDILMIGALLDPAQVGIYNAATKTSYLTSFVYTAIEAIAAPTIAALYTAGNRAEMQKMMTTMAHLVFWPTMLITLFIIVFGYNILEAFGSEFIPGQTSLIILVLGQLVNAATGPVGYMLDLTGHQDQSARVRCCTALVNILLNYILIPKFGIMGAAIATSTAVVLDNLVIYFLAVKYIGVHASIFSSFTLRAENHK